MAGERILMIEDDEQMIALGELILENAGYNVLSATDGASGLEVLDRQAADLVLLDIQMDGLDGWQVLERMKANERLSQIPVLVLTARQLSEKERKARRTGEYHAYIVKPFVVHELIDEVERALDARP